MKRIFLLIIGFFFAFATAANAGEFYSCIDRDGNTILTNSPQDGMTKCESMGGDETTMRKQTGCEIVNFSQYEVASGGGSVVGGYISDGWLTGASVVGGKRTCVSLTIKNSGTVERTITGANIVAVTKNGSTKNPKGFMTKIKPQGQYTGDVCFGINGG